MFHLYYSYVCIYRNNGSLFISTWYKSLHDDPLFLLHFRFIYMHIFHFPKYKEMLNSRSKMAHLPLKAGEGDKQKVLPP